MTSLAITSTITRVQEAQMAAKTLALPYFPEGQVPETYHFLLIFTEHYIGLKEAQKKTLPLFVDFVTGKAAYRSEHATFRNELLARAIGMKPKDQPKIIDATAGLGTDSFILAKLGFDVIMLEKSPIMHLLLTDGLQRAFRNNSLRNIVNRMHLYQADAIDYLKEACLQQKRPDVIYLDPMFPERKKSASVKKEMVILQNLLEKADNLRCLFEIALTCALKRVVVKRPRLAKTITPHLPTYSLSGKSSRFDIYLV